MNSYQEKRKLSPFVLLILLVAVGSFSIKFIEKYNTVTPIVVKSSEITIASSTIAQSTNLEPVTTNNQYEIIAHLEGDQVTEIVSDGDVLGCNGDIGETGCSWTSKIDFQPLCSTGGVNYLYDPFIDLTSRKVPKDSEIRIHRITAPKALFSGSEYWENDRREITNDYPVFPSNANYISTEDGRGMAGSFCIPGVDCDEINGIIEGTDRGAFAVNAKLQLDGEKKGDQSNDKAIVKEPLLTACKAASDNSQNPMPTNILANILEDVGQLPGEHPSERHNGGGCIVEDSMIDIHSDSSDKFTTCIAYRKPFEAITSGIFDIAQQVKCIIQDALGNTEECYDTAGFVIYIDAIFGSTRECGEYFCANRYIDSLQAGASLPGESEDMVPDGVDADFNNSYTEPIYMSTPCQIISDKGSPINTLCVWDISPIREWYDRQAKVSLPGEEDFPTSFEDYFEKVMYDVDRRGGTCGVD